MEENFIRAHMRSVWKLSSHCQYNKNDLHGNLAAKESGLECTCVNNDDFTVLVSGVVDIIE